AGRKHLSARFFLLPCHLMSRSISCLAVLIAAWPLLGAERYFDFSGAKLNQAPPGFRSTVSGEGKPGDWQVIEDRTGPTAPLEAKSSVTTRHQVLAQLSRDTTDEHFPMLIFEGESFGDFTLTTQ